MTKPAKASSPRDLPPHVEALRLLALEAAGAAPAWKRRLIAAGAPVLDVLFRRFLVQDVQDPAWPDRDRFIMSPDMQPLACALLHLLGRESREEPEASAAAAAGATTEAVAPDDGDAAGAADAAGSEVSAAAEGAETPGTAARRADAPAHGLDLPLQAPGHGLAAAVGMALATRLLRERFGAEVFDHATFVLIDDRDVEPGIAQEAIAIAPWLRPHRLCVLHLTAARDESSETVETERQRLRCPNHLARFAAAGWHVQQARADDAEAVAEALEMAAQADAVSEKERRPAYVALEYDARSEVPSSDFLRDHLGWGEVISGEVPGAVRDEWRLAGLRGRKARRQWAGRLEQLEETQAAALEQLLTQPLPETLRQRMRALRMLLAEQAADHDLQAMLPVLLARGQAALPAPEMVIATALHGDMPQAEALPEAAAEGAGSAGEDEPAEAAAGAVEVANVLDVGLRPLALAALLAGLAAHGGVRPVGVVRRQQLAGMLPMLGEMARAGLSCVLFVLEEDGCRHAPVEATPVGVECLCPADAVELVECWQLGMQQPQGPALLLLPAGRRAAVRTSPEKVNLCALGGYELFSSEAGAAGATDAGIVLHAAGRSVAAALTAARALDARGMAVRLFSVPAPQRLALQEAEHQARVLEASGRVRLLVPPGELRHAWSALMRAPTVVSPCDEAERQLDDAALAVRIETMARALADAGGDAAAATVAHGDAVHDGGGAGEGAGT